MYEFEIIYNGFTLNFDEGYTINGIQGLEGLPIRVAKDDLTGRHGGNIWNRLYGMREIKIQGECFGDDATTFFERLNSLIDAFSIVDESELVITLWNGSTKRINAKVVKAPEAPKNASEVTYAGFDLVLLCEEGFFLDEEDTVYETGLGVSGGGAVPTEVPMSLSPSTGDVISINNTGDVSVIPIFEIFGEVDDATVTNLTTGESFQIGTLINSGDKVTVQQNQGGKTVKLNDSQNYFQYFSGDILTLGVGVNNIKFSASTFSSEALLRITYVNKYLAHG